VEGVELVEKYAILMLGVKEVPIPSEVHIQKELFILSNVKPDIQECFNYEKHYLGPYSRTLNDIIKAPLFVSDAFSIERSKISLKNSGQSEFNNIKRQYVNKQNFSELLLLMRLIRDLYDKLSSQELLFLVYETYPKYTENSDISDGLLKNANVRRKILCSLLEKGAITKSRYQELLEVKYDQ
jgi:hypothetical protein